MLVIGALTGAAVGFCATLIIKPGYRTQCLLEPKAGADADAITLKLLRPSLVKSVSNELSGDKTFYGSTLDVRGSLTATKVAGGLVRLRCAGPEPLVCERVLGLILDEYTNSLIERHAKEDEGEVRLIRNRISEYRKAAATSEEELNGFIKKYTWLAGPGDRKEGVVIAHEKLERAHADNLREIRKTERELAKAEKEIDKIKSQHEKEDEHVVTEMVKEINPAVLDLNVDLLAMQKALRQYLVDSSEEHPIVKRLRKQIESTERMIAEKPQEIIKHQKVVLNPKHSKLSADLLTAEGEIEKIRVRRSKLQEDIDQYERGERDIPPGDWKRIVKLEKERRKDIERLEALKGRLAAILGREKDRDAVVVDFSILDPPTSEEVLPEKRLIVAVAALVGLFLGAVIPFPGKRTGK